MWQGFVCPSHAGCLVSHWLQQGEGGAVIQNYRDVQGVLLMDTVSIMVCYSTLVGLYSTLLRPRPASPA